MRKLINIASANDQSEFNPHYFSREPLFKGRPKVALVRGPIVSTQKALNNEATPSIALAYLAGFIKDKGYECQIIDAISEGLNHYWDLKSRPGFICHGLDFEQIVNLIDPDTEVIGFSIMFSGEWPVMRDLIALVRSRFPRALIVGGGEHISALPEFTLRASLSIDICIKGEGEQVLFEVLESFKDNKDFSKIGGLAYLDEGDNFIETSGVTRIRDVNSIPWPYWPEGYLEKFWDSGKSYGVQSERDMPIMASRGCPYQCTFCSNPLMWTTRYILRDPDDLIREIEFYIKKYKITALQFYDLTAITKRDWTIEYCNKLIEKGIQLKWSLPSGTRSEALDEEVLSLLYKTGCNYLVYAPESGSKDTLKKIKKRIDLKRLTTSVLSAKKQKLILRTNLIIGFPHEKRKDIFSTIIYGLYLAIRGVDEVTINIFSPYPGTEIFSELLQRGDIVLGDDYFCGLTALNSEFSNLKPMTCNKHIGKTELAFYRFAFLLTNYLLGYIIYPSRIVRTVKNIYLSTGDSATVFEHRLKDLFKRSSPGGLDKF